MTGGYSVPNIELHGYELEAAPMKLKIRRALKDFPNAENGEIVTTIYPTQAEDFKDKMVPFLRIIATFKDLPEVLDRLRPLNEGMEVMLLGQWIPKQTRIGD